MRERATKKPQLSIVSDWTQWQKQVTESATARFQMLSLQLQWGSLQNQPKRELLQESLLTCFSAVKAVRHQPARESLKRLFIPSLQVSKLLSLLNFQLDSEICVFLEIIFFSICYIWMIFEFLKAAMPILLRNPDKYEIFSSYADIYRLLELSRDTDNLTRTFFFFYSLGSTEIP